jgi:6,7-dimethyl-8-ribityllumazine synthase
MATKNKNLSVFESPVPSAVDMKFGIVVSEWNRDITEALRAGAVRTLKECGCTEDNIIIRYVPGAFELALGARLFAEHTDVDGVITLGCVIQGETPHFDYVCQGAVHGINQVMQEWGMPVAFGLLTTLDRQQALDRAGGRHGNKGDEAAAAIIKMVSLQREFEISAATSSNRLNVN